MSRLDRNLGVAFQTHLGVRPRLEGKQRTPLSSRVATCISWSPLSGLQGVKPPVEFGERTRDCSPGNAGKRRCSSREDGTSRGFLELQRQCGISHEVRRGVQGVSRVATGKSVLHARGEGERVIALESWLGNQASRSVEEGLSRSFSGCGMKPLVPSTCAGDLRELLRVPLRSQGYCGVGRGLSGLHWVW